MLAVQNQQPLHLRGPDKMMDKAVLEKQALEAALRPLGEIVVEIGINKRLNQYTKDEMLRCIECIVDAYQNYLTQQLALVYEDFFEVPDEQ